MRNYHRSSRGVTIIELLIAAFLVASVVSVVSLLFPRTMQVVQGDRNRWEATNMATSKMQEIKSIPYPQLAYASANNNATYLTVTGAGNFADEVTPVCDCSTARFDIPTVMPTLSDSAESAHTSYRRQVCLNRVARVGTAWQHRCAGAADTGYINVRVRVTWIKGNTPQFIELENMISE